jgi:hypothetical protein
VIATATEKSLVSTIVQKERRSSPRLALACPVLACPFGPEFKEEVRTLSNTSADGLYFETHSAHYREGMPISVIVGYGKETRYNAPSFGRVVRVDKLDDGNFGIAVQILMR